MSSYKDLIVWQRAMQLVHASYSVTKRLPSHEHYVLAQQLNRAAISVPLNIAEGYRRNGRAEFRQFCGIALGSAAEVETQLYIAQQVYHIDCSETLALVTETQKMLYALTQKLN